MPSWSHIRLLFLHFMQTTKICHTWMRRAILIYFSSWTDMEKMESVTFCSSSSCMRQHCIHLFRRSVRRCLWHPVCLSVHCRNTGCMEKICAEPLQMCKKQCFCLLKGLNKIIWKSYAGKQCWHTKTQLLCSKHYLFGWLKKIIIERKRKTYSRDAQYQKKSTLDLDLLMIYIYYW